MCNSLVLRSPRHGDRSACAHGCRVSTHAGSLPQRSLTWLHGASYGARLSPPPPDINQLVQGGRHHDAPHAAAQPAQHQTRRVASPSPSRCAVALCSHDDCRRDAQSRCAVMTIALAVCRRRAQSRRVPSRRALAMPCSRSPQQHAPAAAAPAALARRARQPVATTARSLRRREGHRHRGRWLGDRPPSAHAAAG